MFVKLLLLAPTFTRIGVPCIVFREESEYDAPRAQFLTTTSKHLEQHFRFENYKRLQIIREIESKNTNGMNSSLGLSGQK